VQNALGKKFYGFALTKNIFAKNVSTITMTLKNEDALHMSLHKLKCSATSLQEALLNNGTIKQHSQYALLPIPCSAHAWFL
jgi:hypothetical protein